MTTTTAWYTDPSSTPDPRLIAGLARQLSDSLAEYRIDRSGSGHSALSPADEREFAKGRLARLLDAHATQQLTNGSTPLSMREETELASAVLAKILGLGRIQPLLDDATVNDIHIRGAAPVWLKHTDGTRSQTGPVVDNDDELIDLIRMAATRLGRTEHRFDAATPELNLQLPDGSRLFATMEVSAHPTVVIRKHRFELSSLLELEERGLIDEGLSEFLAAAVRAKRNIIIAGGTGTGKTTLLRALLNEAPPSERIVTIEDAYELGIDRFADRHPDHDMLQSRPANIEGKGAITIQDLARMALRMDPDRVVIGEIRGGEAFPMLMAMSQGNNGSMCTMHADSTRTIFPKLAAYVSMAETGLPVETVNLLIASALHLVVQIEVIEGVRRVTSVREIVDADGPRIISNEVYRPGPNARAVPGYPLRDATLDLLVANDFDPNYLDKPEGWWQS